MTSTLAPRRVPPGVYQPRLRLVDHAWRLALCLGLSALFWSWVMAGQREHPALLALDVALGLAAYVLVLRRRRHPLVVALLLNAAAAFSATAGGPAALAAVSLATRRVGHELVLLAAVVFTASTAFYFVQPFEPTTTWSTLLLSTTIFTVVQVGWGMYLGSRREYEWTLEQRARAAESERDDRVRSARTAERTRIAREMHDVLAHRISQISLHAGALSYREDLDAATMRTGVREIQGNAHLALTELRDVLGLLREQDGQDAPDRPQPTYADLPALVAQARAGGARVRYDDELAADHPVPDQVGRTLYRAAQEGLTNAGKHAPGSPVHLRVVGDPVAGIDLWLRNPLEPEVPPAEPATPGAGLGLVGLRERVDLTGGLIEAGPAGDEHVLHIWLPWRVGA